MFGTNLYWHPFWMHWGYGMGKLSREHGHLSIDVDVNSANEAQLPTLDTQSKLLPIALQGLQRASSAKKKPRVLISVSGMLPAPCPSLERRKCARADIPLWAAACARPPALLSRPVLRS